MADENRTMPRTGMTPHTWLLEGTPDNKIPAVGVEPLDRQADDRAGPRPRRNPGAQPRDLRDDLDGAGGAADHRREPPPQLHRPRRVPADGRDRAALHPDARRPLPRPGRDDRRAHPGLVRGDHARRAVAEVELARAPRGGRQADRPARTWSSAATCTSSGRSSAATSTSSRGSSRCSPASTRSGPRTSSRTSTRTRSASPPCSARRSPATTTTSSASTTCSSRLKNEQGPRRAAARRRAPAAASSGRSSTRDSRVGLPARAGALDQRLRPQVRARLPRHRLADLPREVRPRRGPRLLRELPRQDRRDLHAELLDRLRDGAGPVLQLRPLRTRRLHATSWTTMQKNADGARRPARGDAAASS